MRRLPPVLSVVVAACAVLMPGPAAARTPTRVISAYAYFVPPTRADRQENRGTVHFQFRTTRRLGEEQTFPQVSVEPGFDVYRVSGRLNCYEAVADVPREGRGSRLRPGTHLRIRVGRGGRLLDRRFTILRQRPGYGRGGLIGCTQDPEARAVLFNMFNEPLTEPPRFFFTANSGPYVDELRWTGWGTDRAVGRGTFISDCASCGDPVRRPTRIVLARTTACPAWGAMAYTGRARVYDEQAGPGRWVSIGVTDLYC